MSLESLCNTHRVVPEKETDVRGLAGGSNVTYTPGVKSLPCFVQPMRANDLQKYSQSEYAIYHTVYFARDPQLDKQWSLRYRGNRRLYVIDLYNECEIDRLWVVQCGEKTQGPSDL